MILGFGPEHRRDLQGCAIELVSELDGDHLESAGPILDVLVALGDKPPEMVARLLVIGVIESRLTSGRPGAAGEVGMFQIMPATAAWAAKECGIVGDYANRKVNAKLAYCYFDHLYKQSGFDRDAAVAAYNAGPKAIRWVHEYGTLPKVTANYLWKYNRLMGRTTCGKF